MHGCFFKADVKVELERSLATEIEVQYVGFSSTKAVDTIRSLMTRSGTHCQFPVPFQSQLRGCGNRGAVNVAEDKIRPTLALMFHQEQVRRTLKYLLRGTLLAVLPWEQRTDFLVLTLLSSSCQHFQFHLPLAKCSFLFLSKEAERAFWRPHRQSQKASRTANNSERTPIWWVKCKRIRDIWITFLGKYTWAYNVKQGSEWWGSGEENALKNVVWVLPIAKCLKQIIWDVLPSLEHGWIHPSLLLRCHFQTRHTR